jgi:hypothetical protein
MTVQELIAALSRCSPEAEVCLIASGGYPVWDAAKVDDQGPIVYIESL